MDKRKAKARATATASTQDHLAVRDIRDDLIINKNGSVSMVIQTSAINFDLLAEYEQDNKILAFGGLLNSLNFRVQIMIRTKRIDISNYITYLRSQRDKSMSEGLQKQLDIYTHFIENLIVENDVLDKTFFIIVPYHTGAVLPEVSLFKGKKSNTEEEAIANQKIEQLLEKAKIFLNPKRDHILKQLSRMGLSGHQLTTKELISELYTMYNPEEE
ncbi:hypothetical protein KBG23_02865 [Candidatus Dojkabacteria bacterium]|jgi:hypothetical protein|nr:hypothetical protein [Candidatus Dojkabacteria bacterium]